MTKLKEEPATTPDLAEAVRSLAGAYQQLAMDYVAEVPEPESQALLQAVDGANAAVFGICQ